jgi:acyl carrier protein
MRWNNMNSDLRDEIVDVIMATLGSQTKQSNLSDEFQLAGNILDSMAVTNLILALEDHFGFSFDDQELTAEAFETVGSLVKLVESKL